MNSARWLGSGPLGVAVLLVLVLAGCKDEDTNLPFTIVTTPTQAPFGPTPIFFTVIQQVERPVTAQAQFTTDGGFTFPQATLAAGSPSLNLLQGRPEGMDHFFFWDPQADLGPGVHRNVVVRVFGIGEGANPSDTAPLIVDLSDRLVAAPAGAAALSEVVASPFLDGSVYVTAGRSSGGGLNSAGYRFLPSTNTIEPVPTLSQARTQTAAALLTSGQVVVVGGSNSGTPVNPFDVVRLDTTGAVTVTPVVGGLAVARSRPAVAGTSDGRAVVLGGDRGGGVPTQDIEVFTPSAPGSGTGTISTVLSSTTAARIGASATRLSDGRILLVGGVDGAGTPVAPSALLDSGISSITTAASLGQGRAEHGSVLLPDGRVVVVGGTSKLGDDTAALSTAEIFDPEAGTFTSLPPMRHSRRLPGVTYANGAVIVFGGSGTTQGQTQPERFDLKLGQWVDVLIPSALARPDAVAVTFASGQVFVAGGDQLPEVYTPNADLGPEIFESLESIPSPRADHTATRLQDGSVLIAGGTAGINSATATAERFDPTKERFSAAASMAHARADHAAVLTTNLTVLVAGGRNAAGLVSQAELYDAFNDRWTAAGSLNVPRAGAQAGVLGDGQVLVVGGTDASGNPVPQVERWDPQLLTFTVVANLTAARSDHEMILANQRLVVGPGQGSAGPLDTVEALLPFSLNKDIVSTGAPRSGATLTVLNFPGFVVVSGGRDTTGVRNDIALLDMRQNPPALLNDRPVLQVPRAEARSIELAPNVGVLIVGGVSKNGLPTDEGEIFRINTSADLLNATGVLGTTKRTIDERSSVARNRHTVTVLPDNTVLIVGGVDQRGVVIAGAEIFRR